LLEHILFGSSYAFACAVQPGPLQAFLLSQVAQRGWRRTLPAAFSPLLSDGPIAVLVLVVLRRFPVGMERFLQAAGGFLLLYLAWAALSRSGTNIQAPRLEEGVTPGTILQAAAVNLLNPNPYLGWTLVLGPKILSAWAQSRGHALALAASFYGTMVLTLAVIILLFGATRFLGTRGRRVLLVLSAGALALLGVIQLAGAWLR
jgi:threonine/homoserine/homoserine lactone efflux protein